MNRFKNISVFILSGALALSFAACSKNSESELTGEVTGSSESTTLTSESSDSETSETSDPEPSETSSENTKSSETSESRLAEIAAVNHDDYQLSESDDLKEMEKKIEAKYGLDVVFGEDVRTEFGDESEQLEAEKYTDEVNIRKALITLDDILKLYPKTFFYQLRLSEDSPVKIYMTGPINSLTYPDAAINAFTSDNDSKGEFYLTIDIAGQDGVFNPVDIMHELVHMTDFKLEKKGILKKEDWAALNPGDFSYRDKSGKESVDKYNFAQSEYCPLKKGTSPSDVYFVCPYSQANAYEDRATLLTNALVYSLYGYEVEPEVYKCPNLQKKMEYWFGLVRKGFDTSYWDTVLWEDSYSKLT